MKKLSRRLFIVITGSFLSLGLLTPVVAANTAADHSGHNAGHAHHAENTAGLSLNQGKKWQTDAPLRQGMLSINQSAMNAANDFHHDNLSKADAKKLAVHITDQVDYLVKNCKLEPEADATLHVLIGELLSAADELSKEPLSNQGLPVVIKTLQLYPQYFDHPGWSLNFPHE